MLISWSLKYIVLTRYLALPLIYFSTSPTLATDKIAFIWGFSKQVLIFFVLSLQFSFTSRNALDTSHMVHWHTVKENSPF